jgi:branched-chain amino acid aminotransferase
MQSLIRGIIHLFFDFYDLGRIMNKIWAWKLIPTDGDYTLEPLSQFTNFQSLNELSENLPQGVYTTFRTFNHNKVLSMESHFSRLEESAQLAGRPIALKREAIRKTLRQTNGVIPFSDSRIRLTLDLFTTPGVINAAYEQLITPSDEEYLKGVNAISYGFSRKNPQAKLTSFLHEAAMIRNQAGEAVNEVLLHDEDGYFLEGLSSNFFSVKNDCLYTPDKGVLMGIIRSLVLRCAQNIGVPISHEQINTSDIKDVQEVFITSASRGILPIVAIDHICIGDGTPGKTTKLLIKHYNQLIKEELELI